MLKKSFLAMFRLLAVLAFATPEKALLASPSESPSAGRYTRAPSMLILTRT